MNIRAWFHRVLGHHQRRQPIMWWLDVVKVIECDCGRGWPA